MARTRYVLMQASKDVGAGVVEVPVRLAKALSISEGGLVEVSVGERSKVLRAKLSNNAEGYARISFEDADSLDVWRFAVARLRRFNGRRPLKRVSLRRLWSSRPMTVDDFSALKAVFINTPLCKGMTVTVRVRDKIVTLQVLDLEPSCGGFVSLDTSLHLV